jgi:hypothetical protein
MSRAGWQPSRGNAVRFTRGGAYSLGSRLGLPGTGKQRCTQRPQAAPRAACGTTVGDRRYREGTTVRDRRYREGTTVGDRRYREGTTVGDRRYREGTTVGDRRYRRGHDAPAAA